MEADKIKFMAQTEMDQEPKSSPRGTPTGGRRFSNNGCRENISQGSR